MRPLSLSSAISSPPCFFFLLLLLLLLVGTVCNNKGLALLGKGDYTGALELFEKALDLYTRLLGPAHPHCGTARGNVGIALMYLGQPDQALEQHELVKVGVLYELKETDGLPARAFCGQRSC